MTALVTGASGLLGHAIAHRLASEGEDVRVLLRRPNEQAQLFDGTSIEWVEGSLEDIESLRRAVQGVEEIYHCAAMSTDWATWDAYYSSNVAGVENLVSAAKEVAGLRRFLHVSSTDVYGYPQKVCGEASPMTATSIPYNKTKILGERVVWSASKAGLPVTVVRPASIYGPRDSDFVIEIYQQLEQGQKQMPLIAGGLSTGGWLYIDNAVDAMISATRSKNTVGKVYNLRDETPETWRDFLHAIADEAGFPRTELHLSLWFANAMARTLEIVHRGLRLKAKPLLTRHTVLLMTRNAAFPIERAKRDFGFKSRVSFAEGIAASVAWMKSQQTEKRGLATVSR